MSETVGADDIAARFEEYRRTGRRRDRNALVEAHMGFAHHVARRYHDRGVAEDDLHQIALLGLVKAVERFDPERGFAFTTFAGRTIEGEIKRHFRDATWAVRVPRSTKELHLAVRRATDELALELGRSPSVADIARHLDIDRDDVVEALGAAAAFSPAPLEVTAPGGDTDGDSSPRLATDDAVLDSAPERVLVDRLLQRLPDRDREIVQLRFYDELTQSEIAERVGVSQMHVSRLLRRSFETMRELATEIQSSP